MNIQEFYASIGEDSSNPLRRFGSEQLLRKYLGKMLSDQTFASLSEAMELNNQELAFRAAHTLKGIALNLDLSPLTRISSQLTELLRDADQIPEGASALFGELAAVYDSIIIKLRQVLL